MKKDEREVKLEFHLPGFDRKDIRVKVLKNYVLIRALRKTKTKVQKKDFFHVEKSYQRFNYSTTIPLINPDRAKIDFKAGVLKIRAPRV